MDTLCWIHDPHDGLGRCPPVQWDEIYPSVENHVRRCRDGIHLVLLCIDLSLLYQLLCLVSSHDLQLRYLQCRAVSQL